MKLVKITIVLMMMSGSLLAQDINIQGTISSTIKEPTVRVSGTQSQHVPLAAKIRTIKLLKVTLSNKAKQLLARRAKNALAHTNQFAPNTASLSEKLPSDIQLGMNQVPVLNQGSHGSCVTFAVTAAVDALLNKGDYISQLCQLQVGKYLEENGFGPSGWEGSIGRFVLSQMDWTGVVDKQQEASQGCGGLVQYPTYESDPESSMNVEEFHTLSKSLDDEAVTWWSILDVFQVFSERLDTNTTLADVKAALAAGDRITFGTLLVDIDQGTIGAVGMKGTTYDAWVLTPEIARDTYLRPVFAGHEMVITGYDDNAEAVDDKGRRYKGLLTLRNSWGDKYGDQGNFYMSYDYFKLFVIEALRVHKVDLDIDDENVA